ncbi:MAG: hypothetical protein RSA22_13615 [Acinetobacter sp.]
MTLTELIEKIGNENIRAQFIDESLVGFKECKHDLEITFATEKQNKPMSEKSRVGIVMWVDREKYEKAKAKADAEGK